MTPGPAGSTPSSQRRQAVREQVHEENLQWREDGVNGTRQWQEDNRDLRRVAGEEEVDEAPDVGVNRAPFLDRVDDRGEVVVREHEVGGLRARRRCRRVPIATPMCASRSAGASFTPSPVIATTWPSP